jgi:succinate dehydrogenase flavin-adding protein (antitoxin of CptAB toxin-antitoxin module)
MVIMEPCGRLRVILSQMVKEMVGSANPSNKKEYEHMMNVTIPDLEKRAYGLAEKCEALGGCERGMCDIDVIKKFFEKTYDDLEKKYAGYKENC